MADWEIEIILAEAFARPTLGAGRLLEVEWKKSALLIRLRWAED